MTKPMPQSVPAVPEPAEEKEATPEKKVRGHELCQYHPWPVCVVVIVSLWLITKEMLHEYDN